MKPHFKVDIFGEKICRINKTRPTKEAYLTNFDYRTSENLPETHVLKSAWDNSFLLYAIISIPVFLFGYQLIQQLSSLEKDNFSIINTSIYLLLSIITLSVIIYIKSKSIKPNRNLVMTYEGIRFSAFDIKWSNVIGIYEVYRKSKTSFILNCIIIKTADKRHHEINATFTKLGLSKLPNLISAYKWRWDKQNSVNKQN